MGDEVRAECGSAVDLNDLEMIAASVKEYEGVRRKRAISDIMQFFNNIDIIGGRTIAGFGEDAAVIDVDGENYMLVAMDGIWGRLIEADPWWAGYCAVLVNVNDIAAMGGTPIAMVNVISTAKHDICERLAAGISAGVRKFGVPMVGGHIHPDTHYDAVDVAIMGTVRKGCVIFSDGAKPGDKVVVSIDVDGSTKYGLGWDSTTRKTSAEIKKKLGAMVEIGEKKLATAGKDISNPGTLGTLAMLLETSGVGATVEIDKIPRPNTEDMPFEQWLRIYPGMGFILTVSSIENGRECIGIFENVGLEASIVGEIDSSKKLKITDGEHHVPVFDFEKEFLTGIKKR
ncbi:MAG: methanogenesis marker 2 protein [Canidatus Methanoxibalbensis ujae]|nr:methanogenesis marker 2 protein [Candidatus Methanoxibalbensis ujae]MCW7077926.1 methanogenesis marker 2 protein [Candidatus Methanoxibalbensis ujae]